MQRAMFTTPVVDSGCPPPQSSFIFFSFCESQRLPHLSLAHRARSPISSFDSRSVGDIVSKFFHGLVNAFFAAMSIANFKGFQALVLSVLDDLNMCQATRDTLAHFRKAAFASLSGRLVGFSKRLRESGCIFCITVSEQSNLVWIRQTRGTICE